MLVKRGHVSLDTIMSGEQKSEATHSHDCGHVPLSHAPLLLIGE